jgi:hypothetical protein
MLRSTSQLCAAFNSQESIINVADKSFRKFTESEMNDFLAMSDKDGFNVTEHEKGRFGNRLKKLGLLDDEIALLKNSDKFKFEAIMFLIEKEAFAELQKEIDAIPENERGETYKKLKQDFDNKFNIIFKECITFIPRAMETTETVSDKYVLDCLAPIKRFNQKAKPIIEGFSMCHELTYRTDGRPASQQNQNESDDAYWGRIHASNSMFECLPRKNKLIIVHNPIDDNAQNYKNRIDAAVRYAKGQLQLAQEILSGLQVVHIIPAPGEGRLQNLTGGRFGIGHIRLRVADGDPYEAKNSKLIDPREVTQSTFNDTDCARYVTTMVGQAVGLTRQGLEITPTTLKRSYAVQDANQFKTKAALKLATQCAAKYPTDLPKQQRDVEVIKQDMNALLSTYEARNKAGKGDEYLNWYGALGGYTANEKAGVISKIISGNESLSEKEQKIANQGRLKALVSELREATKPDHETDENKVAPPGNSAK